MLLDQGVVSKVLPSPRVPAKRNEERMKTETTRYLIQHAENQQIAVDRFLFSEMAYGPVMRQHSAFTRREYMTILLELAMSGSFVIFCKPDTYHFKEDENPVAIERHDLLVQAYDALLEDSAFAIPRTYVYNWQSIRAFSKLRKFIEEHLNEHNKRK